MPIQEWSSQIWVLRPGNEPSFSEEVRAAQARLEPLNASPHLVVDLAGVGQVNSTNLAQLLRLRKIVVTRDARLFITGPADKVWAVFLVTGLDKVFEFAGEVPVALASLQMRGA